MSDLVRRRRAPPSTRLPPAFPGALLVDGCGSGRTFHRRERERRLHGLPRGASGSPASDYGINSRCSVSRWVEQCVNHLSISGNRLLRHRDGGFRGGGGQTASLSGMRAHQRARLPSLCWTSRWFTPLLPVSSGVSRKTRTTSM